MEADIRAAEDRGENIGLMEPLLVGENWFRRASLADLSLELAQASASFQRSLPAGLLKSLAELVRAMNCYYSNLIEGHDTHPIDIERALRNDYSRDPRKRDLQLEAKSHIAVQQWIDEGGLRPRAATTEGILEIHRRLCESLPEDMLWARDPRNGERVRVVPGALRQRDVIVGDHIAVSPARFPGFCGASSRSIRAWARAMRSSRGPRLITGCYGYTRFWMATAASRGSCRMRSCERRLPGKRSGRWRAAWPARSTGTKPSWRIAIKPDAMTSMGGAISAKRRW